MPDRVQLTPRIVHEIVRYVYKNGLVSGTDSNARDDAFISTLPKLWIYLERRGLTFIKWEKYLVRLAFYRHLLRWNEGCLPKNGLKPHVPAAGRVLYSQV
jgi:hypothetical protein